jgi:hypothetical protein
MDPRWHRVSERPAAPKVKGQKIVTVVESQVGLETEHRRGKTEQSCSTRSPLEPASPRPHSKPQQIDSVQNSMHPSLVWLGQSLRSVSDSHSSRSDAVELGRLVLVAGHANSRLSMPNLPLSCRRGITRPANSSSARHGRNRVCSRSSSAAAALVVHSLVRRPTWSSWPLHQQTARLRPPSSGCPSPFANNKTAALFFFSSCWAAVV